MSEWYKKSFGDDYLLVYKHRDLEGAYNEVKRMIEWLQLPAGAEVLDLCCGMGRHSMALTDFGFKVTGVDLSDVLLREAVRMDTEEKVRWLQGDMREVPLTETYDAVVNLFTSFGYFEEAGENEKVLKEIHRLLSPEHGQFIIDFLNPDHVVANLVPFSKREEGECTIEETRKIEDGFVRKSIVIREPGTQERTYSEQVKLFGLDTFLSMLDHAGLEVQHVYGGYDASAYNKADSKRMIFVGRRKGI
ncbi:class I SAM-dependent methyltransferase [Paenibacillus radicis (ex Xue et al. 2023)]|uniref:Class I SAM-dependent methyltransferase n=1 Tax=Paenibacillus radicis (ex Xue et al. 2023) TaxID=2972489 RepID=A0ABT1Y8Y0_9BACL|nr:class I SAM-dependent methyltransferase [Paenibacillus radicis (ex Xue et al. 2023)]MCR8629648.1 class I SAM-dependent methyltransferase [Paenibacillus radicis (ex Xue et al. 2023)]